MEAAPCDDWSVAGFMIPNKIIFTAAIKEKKKKHLANSLGPAEYFYASDKTALLTAASQDKSYM